MTEELLICELRKVDERHQQKTRGANGFSLQDSGTTPVTEHWQQERETEEKKNVAWFSFDTEGPKSIYMFMTISCNNRS